MKCETCLNCSSLERVRARLKIVSKLSVSSKYLCEADRNNDSLNKIEEVLGRTVKEFESKLETLIDKKLDQKLKIIETFNENIKEQGSGSASDPLIIPSFTDKLKGGTTDFREILRQTHNEEKLEQREKEQTVKNFIIHGLAETGDTGDRLKENDETMINSILALIGTSSQSKKITRLGKKMENKPRTLKIEMCAIQEVESLVANLSRIKGSSNEFGKISVTEDYTKNECEVIKRYVVELDPNYIYKIRGTPKKRVTPGEVRQAMNRMQCTKNDKNVKKWFIK